MFSKKPVVFLAELNQRTTLPRHCLGTDFFEPLGEKENRPSFALATKRFRAIDLSCRACDACGAGAGCWAWIPGGGLRSAPVFTPNLRWSRTRDKNEGWVNGFDNGQNFKPAKSVTLVEALKLALVSSDLDYPQTDRWYRGVVDVTSQLNLIPID